MAEDFGFTFGEDNDPDNEKVIQNSIKRQEEIASLKDVIKVITANNKMMYVKIAALLQSFQASPEKPVIKWPNRGPAIDKFLAELNALRINDKDTNE